MSRILYLILVRFLVAVAITAIFSITMRLLPDEGDGANIGAGLLLFALLWAMCLVWSIFDARRDGIGVALPTWAAVGLLIGIAFPFSIAVGDGEWDGAVVASDLLTFIPFWLASMAVLGAIGGAIGHSTRSAA